MSSHTPGPWTMEKSGDGKWISIESDQKKDNWNCLRCEVDRDDCDSEMAEANAHLICAAPELLEALKNIAIAYEDIVVQRLDDGELDPLVQAAAAAIAKAEGAS